MAEVGRGKQTSFLRSNILFGHENNPDQTIPTYKMDYKAFCSTRTKPVSKAPPAQTMPTGQKRMSTETEAKASFKAHPVQPPTRVSGWTKLSTHFKMPVRSGLDTFVSSAHAAFKPQSLQREHLPPTKGAHRGESSLQRLELQEKLPVSTHQDAYTPPHASCWDRWHASRPGPSDSTLKGDGRPLTFETHYNNEFEAKPLAPAPTVQKHLSSVSLGDKDRIHETQTTHSASFTKPKVYSRAVAPVQKETSPFPPGHTSTRCWSCSTREAFCAHAVDPMVKVKKDINLSSILKGDVDPQRNQERMSHTTSSDSYPSIKPPRRPETDADLITRSSVHFGPAGLQDSDYSTTSAEHFSLRAGVGRQKPAPHAPSHILSGPDEGPFLTTAHADYVAPPPPRPRPVEPGESQQKTNIKFPAETQLYSTTHNETYTPKPGGAPKPIPKQLRSNIVFQ